MRETKADLIRQLEISRLLNEELQAENDELRKFVMYVKWLKTDEEFLNLKTILENVAEYFSSLEKEE